VLWEPGGWRLEFGHRYAGQLDYSAGLASTLTGHIGGATNDKNRTRINMKTTMKIRSNEKLQSFVWLKEALKKDYLKDRKHV